jgi:hypothetical protein
MLDNKINAQRKSDSAVQILYDTAVPFDRLWLLSKGMSVEKTYKGNLSYNKFTQKIWGVNKDHSGVIDTAVHKVVDFIVENLREFEVIFKKALTRLSGHRKSCLMKKKNQW